MKIWTGQQSRYAHFKRDGYLVLVRKYEDGSIRYYTKNFNQFDLSFLPVHNRLMQQMPNGSAAYCELWKAGQPASYIRSGIAQRDAEMVLECWSLGAPFPSKCGLGVTAVEARRWGFDFTPFLCFNMHSEGYTDQDFSLAEMLVDGDCYEKILGRLFSEYSSPGNCEGFVLKDRQGGPETYSYKWKPTQTADLRVVGVSAGKNQHAGKIGALIVADNNGVIRGNASGMSVALRNELTEMMQAGRLVGCIVEVSYQYLGSNGKCRHPIFLRIRDDKDFADVL